VALPSTTAPRLTWKSWQNNVYKYKQYYCLKTWLSWVTLHKSPSICFWRHLWFVRDSSKPDSAHFSYQQGFVVQFPRNIRSSEVVSNLNLTRPLKSQVFSAFAPVEQIGKLSSPAKNRPEPEFLFGEKCHIFRASHIFLASQLWEILVSGTMSCHPVTGLGISSGCWILSHNKNSEISDLSGGGWGGGT